MGRRCCTMGLGAAGAGSRVSDESAHYIAELETRLRSFFSDQVDGFDIPPAVLYRLEGFIEAGIKFGFIAKPEVRDRLIALAERHMGPVAANIYRNDDRLILHVFMPEAPVYPSTQS